MRLHRAIAILILAAPLGAGSAPPKAGDVAGRAVDGGTATFEKGGLDKAPPLQDAPVGLSDAGALPDFQIGAVQDRVPGFRFRFPYTVRGGKPGPVRLELILRAGGIRNGLLDVQENVELERRGVFEFRPPNGSFEGMSCRSPCFLILKVQRGVEERQIQLPLVTAAFDPLQSRGGTRQRGPAGALANFSPAIVPRIEDIAGTPIPVTPAAGRPLGAVPIRIAPLRGQEASVDGVRAELVFEDRGGRRTIAVRSAIRLRPDAPVSVDLDPKGFVVPETGGSVELRVIKGAGEVYTTAGLEPRSWRIGAPSTVRDER